MLVGLGTREIGCAWNLAASKIGSCNFLRFLYACAIAWVSFANVSSFFLGKEKSACGPAKVNALAWLTTSKAQMHLNIFFAYRLLVHSLRRTCKAWIWTLEPHQIRCLKPTQGPNRAIKTFKNCAKLAGHVGKVFIWSPEKILLLQEIWQTTWDKLPNSVKIVQQVFTQTTWLAGFLNRQQ